MTTLKAGDAAPKFYSKDQDGNNISLDDYRGKKLVMFFYPKADTPGCTAEACNLNENLDKLNSEGYEILGVSADNQKKQSKFKEKYGFNFPLLADESQEVVKAYGVWGKKKFMGKTYDGIHRTTFIIDENGKIEEVIQKVDTKNHTDQILS